MSEVKHTPGPWRPCEPGSNFAKGKMFTRPVNGENLIATVSSEGRFAERQANARLIAAAPDMLEALKHAAQRANETGNDVLAWQETVYAMHKIIDAAIAKAEGRHKKGDAA